MNIETTSTTAMVGARGATVAPKASAKRGASRKSDAPPKANARATAPKKQSAKKAAAQSERKDSAPPAESKSAKILELIGRVKGATLTEIMKATDWQAHSVRGYVSSVGKKHKLTIESSKNEAGERVYKMVK